MLLNLHVKNLAIIDEVEVDFSQQLNVLTGETGAGKSIIIGSINLALGGRIPKEIVRQGADYGLVELVFSVDSPKQVKALEDIGIAVPDGEVLISRRISASRSVNRINGESVTLAQIRQAADLLIDIHGQNEQQSLLKMPFHREILDRYGREELGDRLDRMEAGYREYQSLLEKRSRDEIPEEERLREISFLRFELEEITEAHLREGEEEELVEQYRRLSHATQIAQGLTEVYALTGGDSVCVSALLARGMQTLHRLAGYDENVADFSEQLSQIDALVSDLNREISDYMEDYQGDDGTLDQVERRLDQVRNLQAKYGSSVEQIQEYAAGIREKLERYEQYDAYRQQLDMQITAQEQELRALAQEITGIRQKKSLTLEREITRALADLNFLQVQFQVAVRPLNQFTAHGMDEVEFMLSPNPGEPMKPIGQAASGGELSRVMLAVKAVLAGHDEIPTLIFDEIDAGISGRTAQMVAEKMAYIADTHQVICISHLAQIAAMADAHYLIEKENQENHTSTQIRLLTGEEPVRELARILGGVEITQAVYDSASEMKKMAEQAKEQLRSSAK